MDQFKSLIVDYSLISEFAGTAVFRDFVEYFINCNKLIYVSRSFKLFHYCVLHQVNDVELIYSSSMRSFCTPLINEHRLNEIASCKTDDFISEVNGIEGACLLLTPKSILMKRIKEMRLNVRCSIGVIFKDHLSVFDSLNDCLNECPDSPISPLASRTEFLDAAVFCNIGDIVYTGRQEPIKLEKRISAGAEGMVFITNKPSVVAKIYHRGMITPLRWRKLMRMVEMGIKSVGICWPIDLLFYKDVPVGYTMMMGKGQTLGNVFDGPDAMVNNFPDWKRLDIVDTLINVVEKYLYLHMNDIVAGDIQLKNALLFSSSSVYLIDMDSIQVGSMPCPVGTEEFTVPELWGKNFSGFLRELHHEDYSIAMLVFSMLFCGLHPYATRNGKETLNEEILDKAFPYSLDNSNNQHIPKGGYEYIWYYLPDYLRIMLYNTFKIGKSYEAIYWYEAILNYKKELMSHAYSDEEAYEVFPKMDYHRTRDAEPNTSVKSTRTINTKKSIFDSVIYPNDFDDKKDEFYAVASNKRYSSTNRSSSSAENSKSDKNNRDGHFGIWGKNR